MIIPSLKKLENSKFRSRFKLTAKDIEYAFSRGEEILRKHARDFISKRLAPKNPSNDGKQTPYKGHPVFIAQHATGTCCRSCLQKWYKIPRGRGMSKEETAAVVDQILAWIRGQIKTSKHPPLKETTDSMMLPL